jgi:hypothetical protein
MRFIIVAACVGLLAFPGSSPAAQQRKGQGKVLGAVWEFEAKNAGRNGEVIEKGRFRATLDGRVFDPRGNELGSYKYTSKAMDKVMLKMTRGKLKGTIDMVQVGLESPTWQGTWKMEDGTSARLNIKMLRD